MLEKDTPFTYVDTHSGSGIYDLQGTEATQLSEHKDGALRLLSSYPVMTSEGDIAGKGDEAPARAAIRDYVDAIRWCESLGAQPHPQAAGSGSSAAAAGRRYPGSPLIAARLLRAQDRLVLYERVRAPAPRRPAPRRTSPVSLSPSRAAPLRPAIDSEETICSCVHLMFERVRVSLSLPQGAALRPAIRLTTVRAP